MSELDKAIADVKAMDLDGDAGWTAEEVAATGAARDQATIATILNAVASGELIPKAEAKMAVAEAYRRAGEVADPISIEAAEAVRALADTDALAEVQALKAGIAQMTRMLDANQDLLAASEEIDFAFDKVDDLRAERDALTARLALYRT